MITPFDKIKKMVKETGAEATASALSVTSQYVYNIINGKREISEPIAWKLGFAKVVTFEPLPANGTVSQLPGPEDCTPIPLVVIKPGDEDEVPVEV